MKSRLWRDREMLRLLRGHGWQVVHIRGSHHILTKKDSKVILTVPVHGNKTLRKGTQEFLLKQAGIESR